MDSFLEESILTNANETHDIFRAVLKRIADPKPQQPVTKRLRPSRLHAAANIG